MTAKDIAKENEIIRAVVGSTVHGLAIEGTDDRDEMGVYIEPPEFCLGIKRPLESYVYRTQPEGVRSGPGDLDLTMYSLRKYVSLAAKGNPSILTLLFTPVNYTINQSSWGVQLRELTPAIVSKQAGHRFLGYMQAQKDRMLGRRGQARLPNRPELVEKYGYDTKYAGHMIRLAIQGVEILSTGTLSLPMVSVHRELILGIRQGEYNLETVMKQAFYLENALIQAMENTKLPEHPDYEKINFALIDMHQSYWRASGFL